MAITRKEGPEWLVPFLAGHYFSQCKYHATRKNERNHFCIDCVKGPMCSLGLQRHGSHNTLQVRRASHMDAVRVQDVQNHLNISDIQLYSINGAKILFLITNRPNSKVAKAGFHFCEMCERSIADPVRFCSIACKLAGARENLDNTSLSLSVRLGSSEAETKKDSVGRDCLYAEEPFTPSPLCNDENETQSLNQTIAKSWKRRFVEQWQMKPLELNWKKPKNETYSEDSDACVYPPSPDFLPPLHEVFRASCLDMLPHRKFKSSDMTFPTQQTVVFAPSTPESVEKTGFRSRSRKGTPHRAPLT